MLTILCPMFSSFSSANVTNNYKLTSMPSFSACMTKISKEFRIIIFGDQRCLAQQQHDVFTFRLFFHQVTMCSGYFKIIMRIVCRFSFAVRVRVYYLLYLSPETMKCKRYLRMLFSRSW